MIWVRKARAVSHNNYLIRRCITIQFAIGYFWNLLSGPSMYTF